MGQAASSLYADFARCGLPFHYIKGAMATTIAHIYIDQITSRNRDVVVLRLQLQPPGLGLLKR